MTTNRSFYAKPTLWQRIAWWHRWPWRVRAVVDRSWDANWVTAVRQNGVPIGWHTDEERPAGIHLAPDRWACVYGLVTGRLRFDVEIMPGEKRPARPIEGARST
jgi:hypothetical protein